VIRVVTNGIQRVKSLLYKPVAYCYTGKKIAVCSQIHTKPLNTHCEQDVELLNVKLVLNRVTTGL